MTLLTTCKIYSKLQLKCWISGDDHNLVKNYWQYLWELSYFQEQCCNVIVDSFSIIEIYRSFSSEARNAKIILLPSWLLPTSQNYGKCLNTYRWMTTMPAHKLSRWCCFIRSEWLLSQFWMESTTHDRFSWHVKASWSKISFCFSWTWSIMGLNQVEDQQFIIKGMDGR